MKINDVLLAKLESVSFELSLRILREAHVDLRILERANCSFEEFMEEAQSSIKNKIKNKRLTILFKPHPECRCERVFVGGGSLSVTVHGETFYLVGQLHLVTDQKWELGLKSVLDSSKTPHEFEGSIKIKIHKFGWAEPYVSVSFR